MDDPRPSTNGADPSTNTAGPSTNTSGPSTNRANTWTEIGGPGTIGEGYQGPPGICKTCGQDLGAPCVVFAVQRCGACHENTRVCDSCLLTGRGPRRQDGTWEDCKDCMAFGEVAKCDNCHGEGKLEPEPGAGLYECGPCDARGGSLCQVCFGMGHYWAFNRFCDGHPIEGGYRRHPNGYFHDRPERMTWGRWNQVWLNPR